MNKKLIISMAVTMSLLGGYAQAAPGKEGRDLVKKELKALESKRIEDIVKEHAAAKEQSATGKLTAFVSSELTLDSASVKAFAGKSFKVSNDGKESRISGTDLLMKVAKLQKAAMELQAKNSAEGDASSIALKESVKELGLLVEYRNLSSESDAVRTEEQKALTDGVTKTMIEFVKVMESGSASEVESYTSIAKLINSKMAPGSGKTIETAFKEAMVEKYGKDKWQEVLKKLLGCE